MSGADDPFARLSLPRRFALDEREIRLRQREALAEVHPDRERDPVRRAMALRECAAISAAARVLLDPRTRAEFLIRARGVDPAPQPPPTLLMQMLEWTERLDAAVATAREGPREALEEITREINARRELVLVRLAVALDGAAPADSGPPRQRVDAPAAASDPDGGRGDPHAAALLLTELRLVERLLERAERA